MPNMKCSGFEVDQVRELSGEVSETLAKVIECPIDWITFAVTSSDKELFCNGQQLQNEVFVDVEWFDRGTEIKDKVASIITQGVRTIGKKGNLVFENITVVFTDLKKTDYYENGKHF